MIPTLFVLWLGGVYGGWKARGWYERRLIPREPSVPVLKREGNVIRLPTPERFYRPGGEK